ncbi:enoyl-CoA hydratase/isomerase family protein [Virgibacillus sp. NKC19-3]|uniref:enoyl-CoA hydratase/isomerase family protein n=1 Tax=Virgibacillus saliphilus TaxID=2831674 RepID=UPI001C9A4BA1|nr:enoyl-CoA hydratase/isomerase family protein [Virgibacillus sp. NKC19-3]MBY7144278.1 enoyl-CoA hydratase/isomerase family protein [Virgibacillus sp. NKC19-3]
MDDVLFSTSENGIATITLNQPKAINALTYHMLVPIRQKLMTWDQDDTVRIVILQGAGSKGFCAGGDIKTLYQARKQQQDALQAAEQFFAEEYKTDLLISQFSKPIIACLDGVVMGGGVGLSYGASHRIITERTKWSMPEMNIGFFPDVGAAYFLNKAPGYTGRYLALTASILRAADVLYINGADRFIPSNRLEDLLKELEKINWHTENTGEKLQHLLDKYTSHPEENGELANVQAKIDRHFSYDTVEKIIASLASDTSDFAVQTRETMVSKSPVSLKVTLEQLIRGEEKTLAECLQTDSILANNFIRHDDFFEGIRSVLIDKEKNQQYKYKRLADVSKEFVDAFFKEP